jgi:hypothetical protein
MKTPKLKSIKEERAFWDSHDSTDYLDDFEEAKDVSYFYTEGCQEGEIQADKDIARGDVLGPFSNAKNALKALKKAKV